MQQEKLENAPHQENEISIKEERCPTKLGAGKDLS